MTPKNFYNRMEQVLVHSKYSNRIEQTHDKMSDTQMANDHSCLIVTMTNETPRGQTLDATMQSKISSRTRCQLWFFMCFWLSSLAVSNPAFPMGARITHWLPLPCPCLQVFLLPPPELSKTYNFMQCDSHRILLIVLLFPLEWLIPKVQGS